MRPNNKYSLYELDLVCVCRLNMVRGNIVMRYKTAALNNKAKYKNNKA